MASNGGVRATLSPKLAGSSRAPSPVRARSPEGPASARGTPVAKVGGAARVVGTPNYDTPPLLRGQTDPFPSTPSTVGTATPISHLPASVSVRRLHSPSMRSSPSYGLGSSVSSSFDQSASTSSLPALSTSPSTLSPSPLTSPSFRHYDSSSSFSAEVTTTFNNSVGRRAALGVRRASGQSAISSVSSCDTSSSSAGLLPPISIGTDLHSSRAHSPFAPTSSFLAPLVSPPLQPVPVHATPTINTTRSPTLASFPSSRSIKSAITYPEPSSSSPATSTISRPPLSTSNTANRRRHARSNSAVSTSSRSSALSGHDDHDLAASWSRASRTAPQTAAQTRAASPIFLQSTSSQSSTRPPLSSVDWSSFSAIDDGVEEQTLLAAALSNGGGGARTSSGSEISGLSVDSKLAPPAPGSPRKEIDEREREARVERQILDLKIRNESLLTVNTSLERLKLKHISEIRELRRRLRESNGGAGLAALRAQAATLDEGDSSDPDDDFHDAEGGGGGGGSGGEEGPEQTWQELLEEDERFSAVAATLENLVRRARTALEYEPAAHEGGRVLAMVEQEDRLKVEQVDVGVQTDPVVRSTPSMPAPAMGGGRNGRGLGIVGWQKGR